MADAKLKALSVARITAPGMHADGGGLYLQVTPRKGGGLAKSWVYRFKLNGKQRDMGLGSASFVGLAEARAAAANARRLRYLGTDPIQARDEVRRRARVEAAKAIPFRKCAEDYIAAHSAGWRNAKHSAQWPSTLTMYVYPIIGDLPVQGVDTAQVMKVLEPIWQTKPQTARRVRSRIEVILDAAKVKGYRDGENPARWRGHLENVLPKPSKVARVKHHAALPWKEVGDFMPRLGEQEGVGALALRFLIYTVGRTGEVIYARWPEIDMQAALWTVPPERMKAGREHRVPLSPDALAVLHEVAKLKADAEGYVFPGARAGGSLSNTALLEVLKRMGRAGITAHGFRSTFRDWAAETGKPADLAEAALAHVVGDKTVQAYQRGDLLERRRRLLGDWAIFCGTRAAAGENVVPLRG